jgi:hypothetical protein
MADRVGRADENLAQDLRRAASEAKYRYFWFEYTGRATGAHEHECAWYHRYHPTDNVEHPTAPLNGRIRCSVKGCSDVLAPARA